MHFIFNVNGKPRFLLLFIEWLFKSLLNLKNNYIKRLVFDLGINKELYNIIKYY
jgi:hypothetical protein